MGFLAALPELGRDGFEELAPGAEIALRAGHEVLEAAGKSGGRRVALQLHDVRPPARISGFGVEGHIEYQGRRSTRQAWDAATHSSSVGSTATRTRLPAPASVRPRRHGAS